MSAVFLRLWMPGAYLCLIRLKAAVVLKLVLLAACRLGNALIREVGTEFSTCVFIDIYNVLDSFNKCRQKFIMQSFLAWAIWLEGLYRSNKMSDCQISAVFLPAKENCLRETTQKTDILQRKSWHLAKIRKTNTSVKTLHKHNFQESILGSLLILYVQVTIQDWKIGDLFFSMVIWVYLFEIKLTESIFLGNVKLFWKSTKTSVNLSLWFKKHKYSEQR